ncbi:hypothetical protein [Shewanella aegiceratis]|uniref:hypothetical protein n=1 Tax=Shewanella aegiceratis TaxID=2864203 RepID=UPI001C65E5A7|nr:hypothetical protein [Shewanella aegiceratis]QYJ83620.1 hypothetical protein K0H80_06275 [Shewanella aegiceratis]
MQQIDSASQSSGANQNDSTWQNTTTQQNQNQPQQVSLAARVGRGVTFLVKWLWLLTMFLLGIALSLLMTKKIFEYSYSLSELDLAETLFFVGLVLFVFHYLKLCYRSDAPLVRKIIMPFVHQAQVSLVAFFVVRIAAKANKLTFNDYTDMPLLDLAVYLLILITLGYSYYWVAYMGGNNAVAVEAAPGKAANKPTDDLNQSNEKGDLPIGQGDSVNAGGAQ